MITKSPAVWSWTPSPVTIDTSVLLLFVNWEAPTLIPERLFPSTFAFTSTYPVVKRVIVPFVEIIFTELFNSVLIV